MVTAGLAGGPGEEAEAEGAGVAAPAQDALHQPGAEAHAGLFQSELQLRWPRMELAKHAVDSLHFERVVFVVWAAGDVVRWQEGMEESVTTLVLPREQAPATERSRHRLYASFGNTMGKKGEFF